MLSARPSRRNSVNHNRSRTMARVTVDHGTSGHRTRSGSAPSRSRQAMTDDVQANVNTPGSTGPPFQHQNSSSQPSTGNAEHASFIAHDEIIDDLRAQLTRATDLNSNLKEQARYAEAGLRLAIQQRDSFHGILADSERREQSKNGEILQAKAEIDHLQKCLDDCKEQIFKMQPLEHMTDSEIADHYRSLCESVSDWTDKQFGDFENPFSRLQEYCGEEASARLVHKYVVQGPGMDVVQRYPDAGSTIITFLIHHHLHHSILRENLYYPSLNEKCEEFISFIENAMRKNEPRRGACLSHLC